MALFNDGPISGIADLMEYETSIGDVASTEGIDTTTKLALAQDEIAAELLTFLLQTEEHGSYAWRGTLRRRETGVADVVVTSPLRRWHTFRALAMIFRDAYDNQLNDRYQGKWQTYEQLARDAARSYQLIGVGLATMPAPKSPLPTITTTAGQSNAGTYCFAASWITSTGEGACSDASTVVLTSNTQAVLSCGTAPTGVIGWNVYAGTAETGVFLQNGTPLGVTEGWTQTMPLASGRAAGAGQAPERWIMDEHRLRRG